MVAVVETQQENNHKYLPGLLVTWRACTTVLVAGYLLALRVSTCLLPPIGAISNISNLSTSPPHQRLHQYVEMAWGFSTVLGTFLFLARVVLVGWAKCVPTRTPIGKTAPVVPMPLVLTVTVSPSLASNLTPSSASIATSQPDHPSNHGNHSTLGTCVYSLCPTFLPMAHKTDHHKQELEELSRMQGKLWLCEHGFRLCFEH
ncbi:Protein orai-3 [Cricetulus griseus]|uniref:Protein orai-3 n=1 Tax=Cricetulus griseus TaxID=10029 RepID=G3HSC0_CRIGR|nr:Protein orai-3 [Cricetulus griseus]